MDLQDDAPGDALECAWVNCDTIMRDGRDRARLAAEALSFAMRIGEE